MARARIVNEARVPAIGCIVEGEGDALALPLLIRRVAAELHPPVHVDVFVGKRAPRSALVHAGGIEAAVEQTARAGNAWTGLLILLDADDDCPAELGPALLRRACSARSDRAIGLVLANREYEAWFLAAMASLSGRHGLPPDCQSPTDPEGIRGAKEWLSARLPRGRRYRETVDQPAFTAIFDLRQARSADSFDKCYREIARLIAAVSVSSRTVASPPLPTVNEVE